MKQKLRSSVSQMVCESNKTHNAYLINLCYHREVFLLLLLLLLFCSYYVNVMLWTSRFFWSDLPIA